MERGDILIVIFLLILIFGLFFFYQNSSSLECSTESMFSNVMSDVNYAFEPQGSIYSKTRIFRFDISSSRNRLEYFGMSIIREDGETLFFENRTDPGGGSIVATLNLSETEEIAVNRFFKKRCYSEVRL